MARTLQRRGPGLEGPARRRPSRAYLGVDRWLVWGISWGSTLALAYAERDPRRVTEIVLASVTMTRPADIDWLYHGVRR